MHFDVADGFGALELELETESEENALSLSAEGLTELT